ncbi:folliculin [Parasteatoda tepidariorum]|uniref:folliculin n=1 Tax=Parasteatoda tepidariorum TaxID=114398 RepID=UPI001C71A3F4|nr:folliculin [Parasteatoda tepidariorum]
MNAVIGICSFCELHGPSVLFCTQAFHDTEETQWSSAETLKSDSSRKSWYGPSFFSQRTAIQEPGSPPPKSDNCEGCTSMTNKKRGFISNDHEARVSFVSTQYPLHPDVFSTVRQACVRSLSCEVCPGREGPIFFGDDHRGHVLSHTFFLKDSQARGFQSWYSIIIVMRDKIFLLNSWHFLVQNLQKIIHELQEKAEKVYGAEQSEQNLRAVRLNSVTRLTLDTFRRRRGNIKARSLVDLTNDKEVFSFLHMWFTWILRAGAVRITERLVESFPNEDTFIDLERQEETDEGFIKIHFSKSGPDNPANADSIGNNTEDVPVIGDESASKESVTFSSIREVYQVLGKEKFHCLAYHTIVGNQIIIKSKYLHLMKSLITCLKDLLPKGCVHPIYYSVTYEDSWKCNFLGIFPDVKIPDHVDQSELHIQIDITSKYGNDSSVSSLEDFQIAFHTTATLPEKPPQVLCEMERAIADLSFSPTALDSFLYSTKEIWMNKVKVLFAFSRGGQHEPEEANKLLTVLGAQEYDKQVLKFWMTGLSTQYKTRILSSSIQQGITTAAKIP